MVAHFEQRHEEFNQNLAVLLKELRGDASFREFAAMIGTTHTNVRQWESGKGLPHLRVLGNIAALKGWTLDELKRHLEGQYLPSGTPQKLTITQLLAEVRSLPLEAVAQVAAVAVETLATRSIANQNASKLYAARESASEEIVKAS